MIRYYYTLNELIAMTEPKAVANHIPEGESVPDFEYTDNEGIYSIIRASDRFIGTGHPFYEEYLSSFAMMGITEFDLFNTKKVFMGTAESYNKTMYSQLMKLIHLRFGDHYVVGVDEPLELVYIGDKQTYNNDEMKQFARKFLGVLFSTKDKYSTLLSIYEESLEKLMNPVKNTRAVSSLRHRTEDYDNDVSTKDIYSDVVATEDVASSIDADQFVSNLSKGIAHTDNAGVSDESDSTAETNEDDRETTMRRIAEIQDSYQKLLYNWSEEFKNLFIEPLNV